MKRWNFYASLLVACGCTFSLIYCGTQSSDSSTEQDRQFLKEGKIRSAGVKDDIMLDLVWSLEEVDSYKNYIRKRYKDPNLIYIKVPDKRFFLLLMNGKVSTLIFDQERWRLWKIQGLGEPFEKTMVIETKGSKVIVSCVKGDADIRRVWTLNFGSLEKGFTIKYDEINEY